MKKYKGIIIFALLACLSLSAAFFIGQNPSAPDKDAAIKSNVSFRENAENGENKEDEDNLKEQLSEEEANAETTVKPTKGEEKDAETKAFEHTENKEYTSENGVPSPADPEDMTPTDNALKCTISVNCKTILNNMEKLSKDKAAIIPKDGIILAEKSVVFYEGESVFNLLVREMKKNKIHMEFVKTPLYNSAYIEGIANIYEFDCGNLSGWMYKVNGEFPNYGCSRYKLSDGDRVEWVYTCDLGRDAGNNSYSGGQKE